MAKLIKELSTDLSLQYGEATYRFTITNSGDNDEPKIKIILKDVKVQDGDLLEIPFPIMKAIHDFVAEKWPVILVQE